jgi:hypothetical protein
MSYKIYFFLNYVIKNLKSTDFNKSRCAENSLKFQLHYEPTLPYVHINSVLFIKRLLVLFAGHIMVSLLSSTTRTLFIASPYLDSVNIVTPMTSMWVFKRTVNMRSAVVLMLI